MKKRNILIFFIGIIVIAGYLGYFFLHYEWIIQKDVIYLRKGPTIIADKAWTGGQIVYYQNDHTVSILVKQDVAQIVEGEFIEKVSGAKWLRGILRSFTHTNDPWGMLISLLKSVWLRSVLLLLAVSLTVMTVHRIFRAKDKKRPDGNALEKKPIPSAAVSNETEVKEDTDENQIIRFFLNLYRIQSGAPEGAAVEYEAMKSITEGKNKVYELRVRHGGETTKRRMTIGPLGEESGSKSKCYYVIFDVHMVIKIPPKPITDFGVYIDSIRKEGEIVAKLLPRECLIPRVSVILRRIRQFHDEDSLTPEKMESRYIRWLTNSPEAQNFLKIGKTFVFFMDLSRYFFLAHIIDNLHNIAEKSNDEVLSNPGIIWNAQEFAGRYGQGNGAICFKMQELYHVCEADLRRHFAQEETKIIVPAYQIKSWFLNHLSGKEVTQDEIRQAALVNMRLREILENHAQTVNDYREAVRQYVREVMFARNKNQLTSIIINMLELLAWLDEKQVAMRDLKPDNLLVAGERSQYPRFLLHPDQFSIGLIDVETAVYYGMDEGDVKQPQLGGTPFYATPSHLIKNDWLEEIFGDLSAVLHLQDWQATIAIIYKVVTGLTLFEKTGRLLPAVRVNFQKRLAQKEEIAAIAADVSRMFWHTAELEFESKLKENAQKFQSITIKLKDNVHSLLKDASKGLRRKIDETMELFIASQKLFPGDNNHQNLKKASYSHIIKLKEQFEQGGKQQSEHGKPILVVRWLEAFGRLKQKSEELKRYEVRLNEEEPRLTVYDVLQIMFNRVLYCMFKPEWSESMNPETAPGIDGHGEATYEATI